MRSWMRVSVFILVIFADFAVASAVGSPLTLGESVARVLENNPHLQAADFDAQAAADRIRQQGQARPYELGVELENLAGTGEASGVSELETTLSLGRVLELGNKARWRGAVAELEAGVLRHEQDAKRLDLLAETAQRFLTLARVQVERKLAQERVDLMRRTLQSVERRHRVGKAPAAERSKARIDLARAELALEETDHLLINGRRELSVMWGEFQSDFETVQADIFHLDAEPDFTSLDLRIEHNPAIARLATQQRLSKARLSLAKTRGRSDLDVRAGVRHLNDTDDVGVVLSLSMPLGSVGRASPYVHEAEALIGREQLLAQDQHLVLRATLSALHQELLHARDRFEIYKDSIIPEAEKALLDYNKGYAAGRYSLLELTVAQETLLEARLESLSSAAEHHSARIEIDRLIGTAPLNGVTPTGVSQ
ncbi:MAG: TolC family protein [Gammaproteobacteria bacterium]|nr:TolC family protein [Gammaproteobacteria bacterium]